MHQFFVRVARVRYAAVTRLTTHRSARLRYSNKTVTLIVHSTKCTNTRVTKKTAQLQSIHPIGGSARVKSPSRQFSKSKITLHTVQLEPVTTIVQLHSRQPADSSERI